MSSLRVNRSSAMNKNQYSAFNQLPPNYNGMIVAPMGDFLVRRGMHDAQNYTQTKEESATLYRIDPERPTPWYNRNPMAQGVHQMSGSKGGSKVLFQARQGNNQM